MLTLLVIIALLCSRKFEIHFVDMEIRLGKTT